MVGEVKIAKVPHILKIIEPNILQNFQDFLAETVDLPIVSFYNGDWLCEPSNHKYFCSKYIDRGKENLAKCHDCHVSWENEAKKQKKPTVCLCHGGLTGIAVPIFLTGQYVGCILSAQFLLKPLTEDKLNSMIKKFELDPEDELIESLKSVKILTKKKLNRIIEALDSTAGSVVAVAASNLKFRALGLESNVINNNSVEKWFSPKDKQNETPLTRREYELLAHIVAGKNNKEIAKELFISVHTVKAHVSAIIEKFGVDDRVQVAVKVIKDGLI